MSITTFPVRESAAFKQWLESQDRAIVHFRGMTCPYAEAFRPVFEGRVKDAPARLAVRQLDLHVDEQWDHHRIEVTPTVVLFEKGQEVKRLEGRAGVGLTPAQFEAWLKSV